MLLRRPLEPATDEHPWVAWLLAAGLTLILFLAVGLPAGPAGRAITTRVAERRPERAQPEQLIFQTLPSSPAPAEQAITPPPAPAARRPERARPAPPAPSRVVPDSGVSAGGSGQPSRPAAPARIVPPAILAPPRGEETGEPSAAPPASCATGPCVERAQIGAKRPEHTLTRAERDSIIESIGRSIPGLANETPSRGTELSGMGGISLPIGLPGGGPSREQRKRDSTINADVTARLRRVWARADSIAAARRRDSLEAAKAARRDSTSTDPTAPPE